MNTKHTWWDKLFFPKLVLFWEEYKIAQKSSKYFYAYCEEYASSELKVSSLLILQAYMLFKYLYRLRFKMSAPKSMHSELDKQIETLYIHTHRLLEKGPRAGIHQSDWRIRIYNLDSILATKLASAYNEEIKYDAHKQSYVNEDIIVDVEFALKDLIM
jgi:hypothetical protein